MCEAIIKNAAVLDKTPKITKANIAVIMQHHHHLLAKYGAEKIAEKIRQLIAAERRKKVT